nr:PREDICTED: vacuolar protein sorting-associated protein 53 homolog [Bemisia tabaci]
MASSTYAPENEEDDDDYADEPDSEFFNFPPEVQNAIEQVIPSTDPLDKPDFNAVNYINSLFPTEQSLSNIDDVINKMEDQIQFIDEEIRVVVRGQTNAGQDGRAALEDAQRVIRKLFSHVRNIKEKSEKSEETVREITRDIKQLDCAKRNLTSAITTLNHVHMLFGGVENLKILSAKRQYGEIVNLLQGIIEVMTHFKNYSDIPQIAQLSVEVQEIQVSLAKQINEDFREAFTGPNAKNFIPTKQLAEACRVVSVLDSKVMEDLLKWFISLQLSEYSHLFHEAEEGAWIDKLDHRYIWFKKHLLQCEDKFGAMFPPHWELSERITVEFCNITRNELTKLMTKRKNELDVKLLLYAIQRTDNFESLLARRFSGVTLTNKKTTGSKHVSQNTASEDSLKNDTEETTFSPDSEASDSAKDASPNSDSKQEATSPFHGIIGQCFQPFLYIYIESLDRNLYELMERFVADSKVELSKAEATCETNSAAVLPSCADLFVFYRKCLVQCTQLSNGQPMLSLAATLKKYLREYANRVLQNNLPKLGGNVPSLTASVSNITRDLRDLSSAAVLIRDFSLRSGQSEVSRYTPQEQARTCFILTSAEYCLETTQQLEEKLKEKIDPTLADKINLSQEQDIFHNVISNCIQLLVQDLEMACEPALIAMSKIQWQNFEAVGDQSAYVGAITTHLKTTVPIIRNNLASSRKYFTQFCIKFVNSFIPKFIQFLYKCKPMSTVGAEQLLLDTHMLKTVLLDLPSIGSQINRKAPASYTKVVLKGMTKAELILKVVMSPEEPESAFVDQFLRLLPESDLPEFQKILEMKGLKTAEKNSLLSLFRPRNTNSFVTGTTKMGSPKHDMSSIRKLNNLIKIN